MRAFVLHDIGDIRLEDVPRPQPGAHEVLVEVKAAGICGSDIPRIYRTGTYSYPLIPGHEFSGRVVEAAPEEAGWIGKRVGVFPLIPCRSCLPCRRGQYEMCRKYSYLGSRTAGGFAEYAVVPADNLIELPGTVSWEAAAMLEPMAVAVHAMRRAGIQPEDRVAVCGLGTIGMLLAMFLREAGVQKLYVIGNKNFQKEQAARLGISEQSYCDSRREEPHEWLLKNTDGIGPDVFFECVGKNETVAAAIQAMAPGGRIQLVGNPASDMSLGRDTYWKILRNQLTVRGSWNSSFTHEDEDDWHYVLKRVAKGAVRPEEFITQRFAFAELEKGLHIMRDKAEEYMKVMILSN
ncbi:MAG: galactitol-1-phosphate 5-dehydrogenase [Blautia sp.]|nr:galactitol-1-phosphate 5-dehydrogenase [Blautia sp.]